MSKITGKAAKALAIGAAFSIANGFEYGGLTPGI